MQKAVHQFPVKVIQPQGCLNVTNATEFQAQLMAAVSSPENSVLLIDLGQVEFLDRDGLMALVSAFALAKRLNRRFSLCSVLPSIRLIFELTQLERVFEIFESRDCFEASYIPVYSPQSIK